MSVNTSTWLDYENTRHGFRERPDNPLATYTEFPQQYRPGAGPYNLPLYTVQKDLCQVFQSNAPNPEIKAKYFPEDKILFPVHPVNLENEEIPHIDEIKQNPSQLIEVRPTSSTRTVFALDKELPIHCIKPHTDLRITRWRRHMEARKVAQAVAVTRILESSPVFKTYPKVGFFPESLGAVYGTTDSQKNWGFIIREMQSSPKIQEPYNMIPLNALYSPSSTDPNSPPLLVEMIKKSGLPPREFISKELIQPLIEGWIQIYQETGVLLEPHGQNVIVEVDEKGKIIRFSHRDFDCELNKDILNKKGFSTKDINPKDLFSTDGDPWAAQGSHLSIIFDNSMKVVLEALANLGDRYFEVDPELIRQDCRDFLSQNHASLLEDHFPRNGKTYNFQKGENSVSVIEKDSLPTWRNASVTASKVSSFSKEQLEELHFHIAV